MDSTAPSGYLDLFDFRQQVAAMYRERDRALAAGDPPQRVLTAFRRRRDEIFATHPQSALDPEQRRNFEGMPYFPYRPTAVVEAIVDLRVERQRLRIAIGDEEIVPLDRVATLSFEVEGQAATLSLYWVDVYGGGLFLPFRDATAPHQTYGGGRYLFDTVKGSTFRALPDLDGQRRMILDFNYAYNPSCAYNYRWVCPLAPAENHLPFALPAGEMRFVGMGE